MSWFERTAVPCLAALLAMASSGAIAQPGAEPEGGRPWVLGLAAQLDDDQSRSVLATLNWSVAEATWLTFAAGKARSPSDRADVSAATFVAGVDHRFGWLGLTFEAEQWGDSSTLQSDDLSGSLYVQGDRFRLAYERVERDIDIEFTFTGLLGRPVSRTVGLDARGDGMSLRVDLVGRWRAYGAYLEYDYSRDLTVLPRIDALNLLSASVLTLANSFIDEERTLGLEWEGRRAILNVGYARDRSAVDGTELESLDAAVLFGVAPRVDFELNIGKSRSDLAADGWYGGLLVLIYGG
jgi:hypothetical protein